MSSIRVTGSSYCARAIRSDAGGQRGDIARRRGETKNRPALGNRLIAVSCDEPGAASRIEAKLDAGKIGRQADAQRFDQRLLVRPQGKECVSTGRSPQIVQRSAFRRRKIGLRNVDSPRQITDLLHIDVYWLSSRTASMQQSLLCETLNWSLGPFACGTKHGLPFRLRAKVSVAASASK